MQNNLSDEKWVILPVGKGNRTNEPVIYITKSKSIRFNTSFVKNYIKDKKFAQILVFKDPDKIQVAFRFLYTKEPNTLRVGLTKAGAAYISGNSLLSSLGFGKKYMQKMKFIPKVQKYKDGEICTIEIKPEEFNVVII